MPRPHLTSLLGSTALILSTLACGAASDDPPPVAPMQSLVPAPSASASAPAATAGPSPTGAPAAGVDDVAVIPADAQKTPSGLATRVIAPGTGTVHPGLFDKVTVNYTGWTKDGKVFDSTRQDGQPATFPVNRVIPGWTEGLQLMVVGEKRRFWIPATLAYGDQPAQQGAPAGDLTFDVELVDLQVAAPAPAVPTDVAAPPANATKTKSGLAYRVLIAAKDPKAPKPTATSKVTVNYTGWTTDGKMFDSSVTRGKPTSFPLDRVIPGWTEGVQLMRVGDTVRFWIPGKLAYDDPTKSRPGAPKGMLVFDVELLGVE